MDFGNIMKQAQEMQKKIDRVRSDLEQRVVEGSSGGGKVKAFINGNKELQALKIDPEVVDPEDVEMLEDMVVAAIREGMRQASDMADREMKKVTAGLGLPPGLL